MQLDKPSATAPASILEMFSVMLLSALLVGMMISESMGAAKAAPLPVGCSRPGNKCGSGCHTNSIGQKPCIGGCLPDADCVDCKCDVRKGSFPPLCECQ
jgi:hypothetical protein